MYKARLFKQNKKFFYDFDRINVVPHEFFSADFKGADCCMKSFMDLKLFLRFLNFFKLE